MFLVDIAWGLIFSYCLLDCPLETDIYLEGFPEIDVGLVKLKLDKLGHPLIFEEVI